jgi:succinate dehydrogenase / fumarate reductase cytochrome b subunit
MSSVPSLRNAPRWFDPRGRQVGTWAFILNRLSALGLTFYLGLHLAVLNKLTQGTQAYNDFVASAQSPLIKVGEVILIAAVVFHGLNGLRLILNALGIGIRYQKHLFILAVAVTLLIGAAFIMRLFGA